MGQPIKLIKGNETITVYGRAQAAVHVAEGWQIEGEPQEEQLEEKPAVIEKPKRVARKPKAKK